jgi:hypothetical protein
MPPYPALRPASNGAYLPSGEVRGSMTEFGYSLSSEEHLPNDLVRYAKSAEEAGFSFALISDHSTP